VGLIIKVVLNFLWLFECSMLAGIYDMYLRPNNGMLPVLSDRKP
jgi:hypothetical protein